LWIHLHRISSWFLREFGRVRMTFVGIWGVIPLSWYSESTKKNFCHSVENSDSLEGNDLIGVQQTFRSRNWWEISLPYSRSVIGNRSMLGICRLFLMCGRSWWLLPAFLGYWHWLTTLKGLSEFACRIKLVFIENVFVMGQELSRWFSSGEL
jgi:hypothetical protein